MKFKPFKHIPALIALAVIGLICLVRWLQLDACERLERMTFDMRARSALRFPSAVATNLGFIFINEETVERVWDGSLGYRFGLYWPRQVYGRLVEELAAQGAKAVAFDIIFGELRPDHPPVQLADGTFVESDDFFALHMRQASNSIIALTKEVVPPALLLTNAIAAGDITTDKDSDGILRRVRAFQVYRRWHAAFRQMEADPQYGVDLRQARIEPRQILLPRHGADDIKVPVDSDGNFDLADFVGDTMPAGLASKARPFADELVWHMGVVLAARELGLDLAQAEIDLPHGRITLHGPGGISRVIPVDADGCFYIDWCLPEDHPQLTAQSLHGILAQNRLRLEDLTRQLPAPWRNKLAVVGSSAVLGNNLTDRGATPLRPDTLLVSKHWNVANSILTGRFVSRAPMALDLALIILLGAAAALITWRLRVLVASGVIIGLVLAYVLVAVAVYVRTRLWLPIILPVGGAMLMTHLLLVTWRVVFEQAERRRVKSIFSTIVSPKIVNELLQTDSLPLGGARRQITVMFADVRDFTELTDQSEIQAADAVRRDQLTGAQAEACFDEQARQTLATVNLYLGLVADTVIQHDGTLDKFIGDCVMAFWGAPTPNAAHALTCVRAAIEAQRAIDALNRQRLEENRRRESENPAYPSASLPPKPLLPILFMGTGINTGMANVGLMGSEAKIRNYTVFGREVNLASRLETLSGRGRILISAATHEQLRQHDPALAATCLALPPVTVKGIRTAIEGDEVPWRLPGASPLEHEFSAPAAAAAADAAQPGI